MVAKVSRSKTDGKKYRIVEPTKPLAIFIGKEHAAKAVCKDPHKCVVAMAIDHALPEEIDDVEVGPSIVKIWTDSKVYRYGTPRVLRNALTHFDRYNRWNLKPGEYHLLAVTKSTKLGGRSGRKTKKSKIKTGQKSVFKGRSIPSRKVSKCFARSE